MRVRLLSLVFLLGVAFVFLQSGGDEETVLTMGRDKNVFDGKTESSYSGSEKIPSANSLTPATEGPSVSGLIELGRWDEIKLFLTKNSVDSIDDLGYPILTEAFRMGQPVLAEHLIKQGADVNKKDFEGSTPLHHAISFGEESSVRYLLQSGAEINSVNELGQTPLHMAVDRGSEQLVSVLLKWGADPHRGGDKEALPVFLSAVVSDYSKIVQLLIEHDESLKVLRDPEGRDAVVLALSVGNIELAKQLRRLGVPTEL